jgi:drug/metabolite transporter (DMT)-like permease
LLAAALHRISAQSNAMIGMLSPIATIVLAWFVLGERLGATDMAGAALVLVGVGVMTLRGGELESSRGSESRGT